MNADPLFDSAAEPDRLRIFIAELEYAGFERVNEISWTGPTRQSLIDGGYTNSDKMTLVFRSAWPYRPPLLQVPGISAWHADQERLCLWREDDSSQLWATLPGLNERIDEWVADAAAGFAAVENARNPEIYWRDDAGTVCGLVDLERLVGGQDADGQHGEFHFTDATSPDGRPSPVIVYEVFPGPFTAMTPRPAGLALRQVRGRWFYRAEVPQPPRDIDELTALLTDRQRERLARDLRDRPVVMFGLLWRNQAGWVATMLLSQATSAGTRTTYVVALRPKGVEELLLRAGPDAATLQQRTVAIIGVGAIGSHVAESLARAGVGNLVLRDPDLLFPANLCRHAAPPGTPAGTSKTTAMKQLLDQYPWVQVDASDKGATGTVWTIDGLRELLTSTDLTIDATGHGGFAELASQVAADANRSFMSVALFRGGTVARVRRHAAGDTPLLRRPLLDRYPEIPPLDDEVEYVGTETGCLAQINNAPPTAVIHAAVIAAEVAVDLLTERREHPDEVIEVLRVSAPPFHRLGRLRSEELPVTIDVTERALHTLKERAQRSLPNETGGILVGFHVDDRPVVVEAIEYVDSDATPCTFRLPAGQSQALVTAARENDPRVGYLGDWHTHPNGAGPSGVDEAVMLAAVRESGTTRPILLLPLPRPDETVDVQGFAATPAGVVPAMICPTGEPPTSDGPL